MSVEQLTDYALAQYGIAPVEMRIIASSLLPTRYQPVWLLAQSQGHPFFDDYGYCLRKFGLPDIRSTNFRRMRPYHHNLICDEVLYERHLKPTLILDGYPHEPGPTLKPTSRYGLIAQECVRIRLNLAVGRWPDEDSAQRLYELLRRVTGESREGSGSVGRQFVVPSPAGERLERYVRLLPWIDPFLTNISSLMRNVCFIPANHAALYGREKLEDGDYRAQHHIVRSCVPEYAEQLLRVLVDREEQQWVSWGVVVNHVKMPLTTMKRVYRDMRASGLLERNTRVAKRRGMWIRVNPEHKIAVKELVTGQMRWW